MEKDLSAGTDFILPSIIVATYLICGVNTNLDGVLADCERDFLVDQGPLIFSFGAMVAPIEEVRNLTTSEMTSVNSTSIILLISSSCRSRLGTMHKGARPASTLRYCIF